MNHVLEAFFADVSVAPGNTTEYFNVPFEVIGIMFTHRPNRHFYPHMLYGPLTLPGGRYQVGPVTEFSDTTGRMEFVRPLVLPARIKETMKTCGLLTRRAQNLLVDKRMMWCIRYSEKCDLPELTRTRPFKSSQTCYRVEFRNLKGDPKRSVLYMIERATLPPGEYTFGRESLVMYDTEHKPLKVRRLVTATPQAQNPYSTDLNKIRTGIRKGEMWVILKPGPIVQRLRLTAQ